MKHRLKLIMPALYMIAANILFLTTAEQPIVFREIIGIVISNISFVLWIIARIQLGNAFSLAPKASKLVTSGLYSKLRHPVYYFSILALIGISIFMWSIPAFGTVAALIGLEVYRIKKEEALLMKSFGKKYEQYKSSTLL